MENALFSDVTIEAEDLLQNRGDENEYRVSSVFDGNSEVEISEEERVIPENTKEANKKRLRTRGERGGLLKGTNSLSVSADDKLESEEVRKNCSASRAGNISVYTSASLDDVGAVPNSVTSDNTQANWRGTVDVDCAQGSHGSGADVSQEKCSVTVNFRLTEEHFCCSARESSLHLEIDIASSDNSRTGFDFPPQVSCPDRPATTQREHPARCNVRKALRSDNVAREEFLQGKSKLAAESQQFLYDTPTKMDKSNESVNCPRTPELSNSDSDSVVEISDSADSSEQETDHLFRPSEQYTQCEKECINWEEAVENAKETCDVTSSGDLNNNEIKYDVSGQIPDDTDQTCENADITNTNCQNFIKINVVEECQKDFERNADECFSNGITTLGETAICSETNSSATVIYNDCLENDVRKYPDECNVDPLYCKENTIPHNEGTNVPDDITVSVLQCDTVAENKSDMEGNLKQNEYYGTPSLELKTPSSEVMAETEDNERCLRTELLSDSDEGIGDDESFLVEGEKLDIVSPASKLQGMKANTSRNLTTQGQGDIPPSCNNVPTCDNPINGQKPSLLDEIPDVTRTKPATLEHEVGLKLTKALGHVSEVPRGIFESILYKLYHRINQRLPRTRRDPSTGPCVKQLVKVFSKEEVDTPKFPRTLSLQVQRTQEQIPKAQLFESHSEINDQRNESITDISTDDETFASDDFPIRSSTPSQEIVVMEIRDELQKANCSRKKVIELIKNFGGKGSYKRSKKNEMKFMSKDLGNVVEGFAKDEDTKNASSATTNKSVDDKTKKETDSEMNDHCSEKDSYAWLTNVSVKNLVAIFSDFGRANSPSPKKQVRTPGKRICQLDPTKPHRTMETQTTTCESVSSCSNLLLLVQPENRQNKMFGDRLERKRSTLSVCLPSADSEDPQLGQHQSAAEQLRTCSSATALLLVSTAEPVRVHALCPTDENCAALTQLAQLLQLPERRSRAQSAARDSSRVRQMVARWDQSQLLKSPEL